MKPGGGTGLHHGRALHWYERKKKKDAERRKARVVLRSLRCGRTLQGALAFRRSTAALLLGLTHPKVRSRTRFRDADA